MRKILVISTLFALPFSAGFLAVIFVHHAPHPYLIRWNTRQPLAGNHEVSENDLSVPAGVDSALRVLLNDQRVVGTHILGGGHAAGEALEESQFADRPDLSLAAKGSQIYFYVIKEDAVPIGGWSENASVIPCFLRVSSKSDGQKSATPIVVCIHQPLRILAIHRSRNSSEGSWLALEVPEKLRCRFAEFALAEKRMLYQLNLDPTTQTAKSAPSSEH
jgi:hypothetical protein